MKIKYSFVCDAANIAQSGNLNVLGIFKNITSSQFPCTHPKFVYVAHVEFHRTEICKHKFKVTFVNDDGKDVIPPLNGELALNSQFPWANIIMELVNVNFLKAGTYQIDLTIDNQHICTDDITVFDSNQIQKQ
jgi:hypothetical protein